MNKFNSNNRITCKSCTLFLLIIILSVSQLLGQINSLGKYLKENYQSLDENADIKFAKDKNVFFIGESHYKKGNYNITYLLTKNILKVADSCIIVMEEPFYSEKDINNYLETGKEELLKLFLSSTKYGDNFSSFLKKLYLLQTNNKKIKVKCVDIPSNKICAIATLINLMPAGDYPFNDSIISFKLLVRLGKRKHYTKDKALRRIKYIENDSKEYNDIFRSYFGKNYEEFTHQIRAAKIKLDSFNILSSEGLEKREQYMYENFRKIILENQNVPIVAQFGRAHIPINYQKRWIHLYNWKSLAARLNTNEDSPVKGKVCSILIFYTSEIKTSFVDEKRYVPIIKKEDLSLFLEYCKIPLTIFNLSNENSPFTDMTDKFQYLIINKY